MTSDPHLARVRSWSAINQSTSHWASLCLFRSWMGSNISVSFVIAQLGRKLCRIVVYVFNSRLLWVFNVYSCFKIESRLTITVEYWVVKYCNSESNSISSSCIYKSTEFYPNTTKRLLLVSDCLCLGSCSAMQIARFLETIVCITIFGCPPLHLIWVPFYRQKGERNFKWSHLHLTRFTVIFLYWLSFLN